MSEIKPTSAPTGTAEAFCMAFDHLQRLPVWVGGKPLYTYYHERVMEETITVKFLPDTFQTKGVKATPRNKNVWCQTKQGGVVLQIAEHREDHAASTIQCTNPACNIVFAELSFPKHLEGPQVWGCCYCGSKTLWARIK